MPVQFSPVSVRFGRQATGEEVARIRQVVQAQPELDKVAVRDQYCFHQKVDQVPDLNQGVMAMLGNGLTLVNQFMEDVETIDSRIQQEPKDKKQVDVFHWIALKAQINNKKQTITSLFRKAESVYGQTGSKIEVIEVPQSNDVVVRNTIPLDSPPGPPQGESVLDVLKGWI